MINQKTISNSTLVYTESHSSPQTNRIDLYKSFWMFFIGPVIGVFVETVWCLVYHGKLECRTSLLLFPFAVVYGCGALVLY